MDIYGQLERTRKNLQALGNKVSELVNASPDVFEDEKIKRSLYDFRKAHEEASQRIENPTQGKRILSDFRNK
jgi:hypothetical protein